MSEFVVHFTGGDHDAEALDRLLDILHSQTLRAGGNAFGAARHMFALGSSQRSICFSEVPLDLLDRLVQRRRRYGLGFHQETIIQRGGGRVWYIDRGSALDAQGFDALFSEKLVGGVDPSDPFWKLTPLVDRPGDSPLYRFEWEREWRIPTLEFRFEVRDIQFLFAPEDEHAEIEDWFHQRTGPLYDHCPYIDPTWGIERIQLAVAHLPTRLVERPTHQIVGSITDYVELDDRWARCRIGGDVFFIARYLGEEPPSDAVLHDAEALGVATIRVIYGSPDMEVHR